MANSQHFSCRSRLVLKSKLRGLRCIVEEAIQINLPSEVILELVSLLAPRNVNERNRIQLRDVVLNFWGPIYLEYGRPFRVRYTEQELEDFLHIDWKHGFMIDGVEEFTSLKNLAAIVDITPIARLVYLERLDLSSATELINIQPVADLHELTVLNLKNTKVFDLTPLKGLNELTTLRLQYTLVTDLGPLALVENLITLSLSFTKVRNLWPLAHHPSLQVLHLNGCIELFSIEALGHTDIQILDLSSTMIMDLSPLARLKTLNYFSLSRPSAVICCWFLECFCLCAKRTLYRYDVDFTPLAELPSLRRISLCETIKKKSNISNFSRLTYKVRIF